MNYFLIFHSSSNTPQRDVRRTRRVATEAKQHRGKNVRIRSVDIDSSNPQKRFKQTNRIIECTTVVNGTAFDSSVNPSDRRIDEMIGDLP